MPHLRPAWRLRSGERLKGTEAADITFSLGACAGHWYDIALRYRRWALEQPWAARGPAERRGSFQFGRTQ